MFDTYKSLMGKNAQQKKEGSIISKSLNFLLRPYRILFRNSEGKPKKAGLEKLSSSKRRVVKPSLLKHKRRAGRILWKKK